MGVARSTNARCWLRLASMHGMPACADAAGRIQATSPRCCRIGALSVLAPRQMAPLVPIDTVPRIVDHEMPHPRFRAIGPATAVDEIASVETNHLGIADAQCEGRLRRRTPVATVVARDAVFQPIFLVPHRLTGLAKPRRQAIMRPDALRSPEPGRVVDAGAAGQRHARPNAGISPQPPTCNFSPVPSMAYSRMAIGRDHRGLEWSCARQTDRHRYFIST